MAAGFSTPTQTEAWAEAEGFQYEVWTDDDKTLALTYGAAATPSQNHAYRMTFLLDADGNLLLTYGNVNSDLGEHPAHVLSDCQQLFPQHR